MLLLYNILTMLQNGKDDSKFPFDTYKKDEWDIEHITAIKEEMPKEKEMQQWLNDAIPYIDIYKDNADALIARIHAFNERDNDFESLFNDIIAHFDENIDRMIMLDFITRQDDRHLSNIAIKMCGAGKSFYPLYDNGRSLFYEDTEQMAAQAVADPANNATGFGYSGTYYDYVQEIATERGGLKGLINLDITQNEIRDILTQAEFVGYRFEGSLEWIVKTIRMIKKLSD